MAVRLEHANLVVRNLDEMIQFLKTAFPEFRIRHDGPGKDGMRWVHVGTDETYIALMEANAGSERRWVPYSGEPGVNHLAYEVDDVEALRVRLKAAGYQDTTVPNSHPFRKRVYFNDPGGNDWEFVQYLSENVAERHDYGLPDR